MRFRNFHKLIWPVIWLSIALCIIMLSVSIIFHVCGIDFENPHGDSNVTSGNQALQEGEKQADETIELPIIMYHALITDTKLQNKYFISPKIFEKDLKYLNSKGYTAVTMTEVINYVHNGTPLPEKPIVLTFDDGYYNNYLYAYPLLKKYNQKAVISIIGKPSDEYSLIHENNAYYSHMTWDQINEMIVSGRVEIQNHTYNMHTYDKGRKGCMETSSEGFDVYKGKFAEDVGMLQQRITDYTGITPNTMTYPFGFYSEDSETVIKEMGFKASLTCAEKMNHLSHDPDCLYKLGRYLRPPGKSSSDFFSKILK